MLWALRLVDYIGGKKFVYSDINWDTARVIAITFFLLSENLSFFIPFIYAEPVFLFHFSTVCFLSDSVWALFSVYSLAID